MADDLSCWRRVANLRTLSGMRTVPVPTTERLMSVEFPAGVPEMPVTDVDRAAAYYAERLGFSVQWGDEGGGGIGGLWRGRCRLFLTNAMFRASRHNEAPVVVWLNLGSKEDVEDLHSEWSRAGALIASPPESKPWKLHEFTALDLDGQSDSGLL
jgi:hypothetical protein